MKCEWCEIAADMAAHPPPLDEWEAGGDQGWPANQNVKKGLLYYGWPSRKVVISAPQREHRGLRAGQQTSPVDQEVTVVPYSWLRILAKRAGATLNQVCKGTVTNR